MSESEKAGRRWKVRWALTAAGAAAVLAVGGPWVYVHVVNNDQPAALTAPTVTQASAAGSDTGASKATAADGTIDGTWKVANGSVAGYRVKEVLFGQSTEAVGRTSSIEGSLTVSGTTVTGGSFTVDMTTVTSDESRRDNQFRNRIMETSTYPTGTFELTSPIGLGSASVSQKTVTATGNLTLHGVTKTVTFKATATRSGSSVNVTGSLPITFEDYGIANPSFGPAQVGDDGTLEFSLTFAKA
jgi:polyisoprenoid-binding protein YceI